MQNFSFLRGWVVFLGKKRHFFLCKTSVFAGLGGLFGTFFVIFLCKTSLFWGAGWSFWVKNDTFFHAKHQLLRGWVVFLSKKIHFFEILVKMSESLNFLKVPSLARSVPKPLKVPSLARSLQKPLKVPSLARSVQKPLKMGQSQACERAGGC